MKLTSLTLFLLVAAGGCGNNSLPAQDMTSGTHDLAVSHDLSMASTMDMTVPPDMAYRGPATDGGPLSCGNTTCAKDQVCCITANSAGATSACATSCADGGISVACEGPGNCGGNPCCATIKGATPSNVMCTTSPAACPPSFDLATRSGMSRLCNVDGDCSAGLTGPQMYPDCCHYTANTSTHFCFNKNYAGLTQGQVACP